MPSAVGPKSQSHTANYGRLVGLVLQSVAILWFIFTWFTFRTGMVEWVDPKAELLAPIYILYILGALVVVFSQLIGMRSHPPQNRAIHIIHILLYPALSLILLYLMIDWVKFGFT